MTKDSEVIDYQIVKCKKEYYDDLVYELRGRMEMIRESLNCASEDGYSYFPLVCVDGGVCGE